MYVLDPGAVGHSAARVMMALVSESTDAGTAAVQPGVFGILGAPGCPPVVSAGNHAPPYSSDSGWPDDTAAHRCYVQTEDTTSR